MGRWWINNEKALYSSDNYVVNMSNYKRSEWSDIWNALYYYFLSDHESKLKKTPYVRNLVHWKKKSKKDKDEILKLSKKFIKKVTK